MKSSFLKRIFECLMFCVMVFYPMTIIANTPIPTLIFFFPLLLSKRIIFDGKNLKIFLLTSSIFVFMYLISLLGCGECGVKDFLFVLYPFLLFYFDFLFLNTLEEKKCIKFLKIFIIIQLFFCVMQIFNIANTNTIFSHIYEYWQEANSQKVGIWEISTRAFGTVGSPIYVAIICYIFSKVIQRKTGSNLYILIALFVTLLSGARIPLLSIIVIEFFDKIILNKMRIGKKLLFSGMVIILLIIAVNFIPFVKEFIDAYVLGDGDITTNYSFTYRKEMLDLMLENKSFILTGGYGIDNLPSYVDNEYVLRFLQFGILNYILLIAQYVYMIFYAKNANKGNKIVLAEILIFLMSCMLTANVLTNLYLMQFIVLGIGLFGNRYSQIDKKCLIHGRFKKDLVRNTT